MYIVGCRLKCAVRMKTKYNRYCATWYPDLSLAGAEVERSDGSRNFDISVQNEFEWVSRASARGRRLFWTPWLTPAQSNHNLARLVMF